ncbi:MAG: UvrD-helicase domain-containing protein [Legionella sp.]|nr:UvrD-helicase domain-containing protein [Legionella sp.]
MLVDSDQRVKATDPFASYIVQAPAGSGKTEILTQRYLRLLSTVSTPEQIIALTFTRKAANEMRERIILALQQAAANEPAKNPHQQMTLNYAKDALKHSYQLDWDILHQSNRLKIITIDSLNQSINQAIPLLERQIAYAQISDKPQSLYVNAARACIQFAIKNPDYHHAIKILLLHVDNKQEKLLDLFKTLLSQRDQWITLLFAARDQDKSAFERALSFIEEHELTRFVKSLPLHIAERLTQLARELAVVENNPQSPRYILKDWYYFKDCNQQIAAALCKLILGSDNKIRKSFDHHVGLNKKECTADEYNHLKSASTELLAELNDFPDFLVALLQISQLPPPQYDPEQWEVLQAMFVILPLLVGHLHLLFSENNEVDFTALSQHALHALGAADNPTDLGLYLDNAIHHLLVDEFQDTSISQFELLTRLVQGWQSGDGKTLFIVGDPMQSIYRFRQAEVGLFLRAKEQGIGPISLTFLELKCNFRSTATLVNWVNFHFAKIFPQQFDIESGAVTFHPSVNVISQETKSTVEAFSFSSKEQEALHLIQMIQHELEADSEQKLAILVRSRGQLNDIINLLRQHRIPYQGTDIDLLTNLEHLRDAWSLTQTLLFPGNRLSWLAVLRSPYCGLSLDDIYIIARVNPKKSIFSILLNLEQIQGLTEEGRTRAGYFIQVMHQALTERNQVRLSEWVIKTLKKLHLDAILMPNQLEDLEQLWTLLDRYEVDGRIADVTEFVSELNKLYSQQATPSRLQVMTIHKSKGLEFDTVFLPGLGSQPNRSDDPMIRWLKLPTHNHDTLLLMSPIKGAHQERCAMYDYLGQLEEQKSGYEAQRVLYVAVTRAKSRLYLLDSSSRNCKSSFRSLLKNQDFIEHSPEEKNIENTNHLPSVYRLPLHFYLSPPSFQEGQLNKMSGLSTGIPRLTGIIGHQILQWICDNHPQSQEQIPWDWVKSEFESLGFDKETEEASINLLKKQMTALFANPTGLWIISKQDKERNEYELLVEHQKSLVTRIIDRTFEHDNKLWIIDFKTGKDEFIAQIKHQQQLNEYAFHLSSLTDLPIHCGVFYLANTHWITWQYQIFEPVAG